MSYKLTAAKRRDILRRKDKLEQSIKDAQKTLTKLRKKKDDPTYLALVGALESAIEYSKRQVKLTDEWMAEEATSKKRK